MSESSPSYSVTGGARIGLINYSWPLAKLTATADLLTVTTSMLGLFRSGTYSFTRDQVISIERYGWIPVIGVGIRIHHCVADYPEKVVFWCKPETVLAALAGIGFTPSPRQAESPQAPVPRGFPLRWAPLIIVAILWNLLMGWEMLAGQDRSTTPGLHTLIALWSMFGISFAALQWPAIRPIFLKPGRSFGEVKPIFLLVAVVCGMMAIMFTFMLALGAMPSNNKKPTPAPPATGSILF